jgi:hypothetical protein
VAAGVADGRVLFPKGTPPGGDMTVGTDEADVGRQGKVKSTTKGEKEGKLQQEQGENWRILNGRLTQNAVRGCSACH